MLFKLISFVRIIIYFIKNNIRNDLNTHKEKYKQIFLKAKPKNQESILRVIYINQ